MTLKTIIGWFFVIALIGSLLSVSMTNELQRRAFKKLAESNKDILVMFTRQNDSFERWIDSNKVFEATGFETNILPDGRVEIVFLRKLTDKGNDTDKTEYAQFHKVIVPAWMFCQITAEAALKLGFEALEKREGCNQK